jgi:hypothetical protein
VLSGGAGVEGCHHVGGVPVERHASPVVVHRRSRVGVARGLLDVSERDAGVEGGGDERVAERVGPTGLLIPALRPRRQTIRQAACRSSRRPSRPTKIGTLDPFTDGKVDRAVPCVARAGW